MCGSAPTEVIEEIEVGINRNAVDTPPPKENSKTVKVIKNILGSIWNPCAVVSLVTVPFSVAAGIAGGIVVGVGSSKNKSEKTKNKSKRVGYALIATSGSIIATTAAAAAGSILIDKYDNE